jgi:chromosome segregation ATPase
VAAASRVSLTTAVVAADSVVYLAATDRTVRQIEDSKERARVDVGDVVSQLAVTQRQGTRVLYCGLENGAIRVFPIPLATTGALAAAAAAAAAAASASSAPASVASFECHASAVSRLRVSFDGAYLFSVSEDGCLAVFEIEQGGEGPVVAGGRKAHEQALPWAEEILVTKSDLQEKLQAMTDLRNKVEELQYHNHMQLRLRKLNYKEKLREVTDKFNHELEADRERYLALEDAKSEMVKRYTRVLDETEQALKSKAEELEAAHARKMSTEKERIEALRKQIESNARQNAEQRQRRERVYKEELQAAEENLKKTLAAERAERQRLEAEKSGVQADFEQTKDLMEEDADEEVDELKATYDAKLTAERLNMLRLKDENAILKRKYGALRDEIKQHKDTIRKREDKQKMLYEQIRSLEKDLEGHLKEIQERDSTIQDKVKRIMQLRKKNQELEKFKFVLDYKIKELKRQIAPRQKEIKELGEQIAQMTNELNNYKSRNAHLQLEVHELGLKFGGAEKEADAVAAQHEGGAALLNRIKADLADLLTAEGDFKKLKLGVKRAYHTHVTREPSLVMSSAPADEHVVHQRQRYYLERSVDALSKKLRKDLAVHEAENRRIMSENIALVKEINELRREIQLLKQRAPDAATLVGGWGGGGTQNVWRNPNESKGDEAKAATAGDADLKGIARAQAERIAELRQLIEAEGGDSAAAATSATETPTREAPRASAVPVQ